MTRFLVLLLVATAPLTVRGQDVAPEYRVKAAYLFNFLKFVEWPPEASDGPLRICVAGRNPFHAVLAQIVRGERVNDRLVESRVILEPERGCHILFVPEGANTRAYLGAARGMPVLTVGESDTFIEQGGIVSFYMDRGHIRFEINPAALQGGLHISSRLLQLARISGAPGAR